MSKKKKVEYDYDNGKVYSAYGYTSVFGRTYCYIKCPFCGTSTKAFVWSLAGGGKKCDGCKAMHTSFRNTFPIKKKDVDVSDLDDKLFKPSDKKEINL